jgi:GTP pyrophosphokinase
LVRRIIHKRAERQKIVDTLCERLRTMLAGLHIEGEVSGRPKHFYSIYKKMVVQNRPFEQIYDLTAVRVIVQTVNDCYEVLGKIHAEWKPVPGRFKDYISVPKQNGYQSLHTTIMSNLGQPFEIQIRTREMHKVAEFGIAAHWKYKEKRENDSDLDQRMGWLRELMTLQGDAESTKEFLDGIKIDLYTDKIFVFTPKGDIVELPVGSTPIDFAYHVHSNVGNRCVGAKINSRMMPLNTKLQSGDFVEIVTSSAAKGPSRDWLKVAVSPNARAKIRAFFKKEMKEENIKLGRDMLEAEAKRKGVALPVLMRQEWLDPLMARLSLSSAEDMYAAVGYGGITTNQIIIKLYDLYRKEQKKAEAALKVDEKKLSNGGQNAVTIKGNDGLLVKLARCCSPVPGDDIIAFISRGRGAVVHRKSCVNIKALEPERLVEAAWAGQSSGFLCGIRILAEDRYGLLVRVAGVIAEQRLSIASIEARVDKQGVANISLSVTVSQTADIENLFKKLQQMPEVITVIRV